MTQETKSAVLKSSGAKLEPLMSLQDYRKKFHPRELLPWISWRRADAADTSRAPQTAARKLANLLAHSVHQGFPDYANIHQH